MANVEAPPVVLLPVHSSMRLPPLLLHVSPDPHIYLESVGVANSTLQIVMGAFCDLYIEEVLFTLAEV
jgi:hypothetical protein